MASRRVVTGMVLIGALAAAPLFAEGGQRRRERSDRRGERAEEQAAQPGNARAGERAVPRARGEWRQNDITRQRQNKVRRQYEAQRWYDTQRLRERQRQYAVPRDYITGRDYHRPYYSNRGYRAPRIIRPSIVTIVPYRPYVYRPSIGLGVYHGAGGSYPYGYTPRGYYDPIPGRAYGGVRITGAPRNAQVFADGYYVGIANDFDGLFQHMNLEAGPHHIEIEEAGLEPIAFDIIVQPGRTITFRADMYPY